jgi:Transglycosylase SLT domain
MKKRLLTVLLAAGVLVSAAFTALTMPAAAQQVHVQLPTGEVVPVDVPPGTDPNDIQLPGPVVQPTTPTTPTAPEATTPKPKPKPAPKTTPAPAPQDPAPDPGPTAGGGSPQERSSSGERVQRDEGDGERKLSRRVKAEPKDETSPQERRGRRAPLRNDDGTPSRSNPGFVDALPGPSMATGVPNFIIRKFRVPPFLLPIYQAAGIEYGIRWEILAAINEIETDYGRNLNVSSAGALGWMQFMPPTWEAYGVDANKDGRKDPYNPVDAIFAAARYLKAANYENDVRAAIWAYNHADWYVDSVLLRARLIAGVPADLIGSLTGLTEGRFPVWPSRSS